MEYNNIHQQNSNQTSANYPPPGYYPQNQVIQVNQNGYTVMPPNTQPSSSPKNNLPSINKILGLHYWPMLVSLVIGILLFLGLLVYAIFSWKESEGMSTSAVIAWIMIYTIMIAIGEMIFGLWYGKRWLGVQKIFQKRKNMEAGVFAKSFVYATGVTLLWSVILQFVYLVLKRLGLDMEMNAVSETQDSWYFVIYVCLVAPFVEEIVYRGILLGALKRYGKVFGIVLSALIFGMAHGNLTQGVMAAGIGLVYGYIALEYSIKWTILLHLYNNLVLATLLPAALQLLPRAFQQPAEVILGIIFGIGGMVVLYTNRDKIKNYRVSNKSPKGSYKHAFRSGGMVVMIFFFVFGVVANMLLTSISAVDLSDFNFQESTSSLKFRATYYMKNGEYEEALLLYDEILEDGEGDNFTYYGMSRAYYELDRGEKALYYAEKATEAAVPDNPEGYYHGLTSQADALVSLERSDEAIELYQKAFDKAPLPYEMDMLEDYNSLAQVYIDLEQKQGAISTYETMFEMDCMKSDAFYGLIELYRTDKEKDKLLELGEVYFEYYPYDSYAYTTFAEALEEMGEYKAAADYYVQGGESTEHASCYYGAVKCYLKLEDLPSAKTYFEKCIELDDTFEKNAKTDGIWEKLQ